MAAFTDVVLQCGVYGQEYILLDDYYKHQCADNNNNVSGADEGKWNRTSILLLLDEYKKYLKNFNDPKMKKKAIWGEISQILKEKGFDIDGVKCERKLIDKKSKYKSTKIHNKQTGNNPKTCPCYQELDDIFGNSPAISPLATCLNLKGIIIEEKKSMKNHESPERKENENAEKIKTEDKVFKALNDFSKELQKKENERMDRIKEMHDDQMTATNLFINIFEKW